MLRDIHQVLEVPHRAQELLSAERTPTLSMAIPAYEILIKKWKSLRATIPELSGYIDAGLEKLNEYVELSRNNQIFALAMGRFPKSSYLTRICSQIFLKLSIRQLN